jgi:hypothetical protein
VALTVVVERERDRDEILPLLNIPRA